MKTLLTLLWLLPTLCFGQGFGSFKDDQPFLAKDDNEVDYSTLSIGLNWYWTFDETSTSTFSDSINSLALNIGGAGTVNSTTGVVTNAPISDGVSYYSFPSAQPAFNFTNNPWTISIWIRQTNFTQFGPLINGAWTTGTATRNKWMLASRSDVPNGMLIRFEDTTPAVHTITLDCSWSNITNQWIFFCFGYETNTHKGWIQVDATARQYTDEIASGLQNTVSTDNGVLVIGAFRDGLPPAASSRLLGQWDEMGVWLRTLTESEVSLLFNNTNGLPLSTFYP